MATDLEDIDREQGSAAVRAILANRHKVWPEQPPIEAYGDPFDQPSNPASIVAKPFIWRDPATIPARQWLYGQHLLRKFLSLDIAAGGVGKSSLKIVEALAMVSGRDLLGKPVHGGPLRVWLYNLEDPDEEIERRIHAAMIWFDLSPNDIGDRLYVNSGRDQPVCLAEETANGARIIRPVRDALAAALKDRSIDVLTLDPFVSAHALSENDNRAVDMIAKDLSVMADECDCSINLVHHVRKQNGAEATADSARGASSLIGAARSVVVYNRMTKDEGERAGIAPEQVGFHFRTANDKANLAPPEAADWHRMNNVDLPNGDKVGVACSWEWPDAFAGVTTSKLIAVQRKISTGAYRRDPRAGDAWAGVVVAEVLGLDTDKQAGRIKQLLKEWIRNGVLIEVERRDEVSRKNKLFVEVGEFAVE